MTCSPLLVLLPQPNAPGQLAVKKDRELDASLAGYLAERNLASGAHHVRITRDNAKLIVVTVESHILVVDLSTFEVLRDFEQHRQDQVATVISIATSADGKWLATADELNRIHIFNLHSFEVNIQDDRSCVHKAYSSFPASH